MSVRRLLGSLAVVMAGLVGCDDDTSPVVAVDASVAGDGCVDCAVECPPASQVPEGFVCAPAGEFWMGSAADEFPRDPDEARHRVRVTRPFFVAVHEVTQAEWQAVVGNNPSYFQAGGDGGCERGEGCEARPVERVTWFEAAAYLNRRSERRGSVSVMRW
ncbi:MAG: SUMF1/EgtB/PvdO family nonheme iron enzyme [bacterium]